MAGLAEIGDADGWLCWLCDQAVDPEIPSRDDRAASIDERVSKAKAKKLKKAKSPPVPERLAHVGCNTGVGTIDREIPWPEDFFVVDPVSIIATTERLRVKGGREVMGRCLTAQDADALAAWLVDRLSRLEPDLDVRSRVDEGGGQYLVSLLA